MLYKKMDYLDTFLILFWDERKTKIDGKLEGWRSVNAMTLLVTHWYCSLRENNS
jgi:hypothetical protein